ncbi:hypothetical protein PC110_g3361 [Phytophthora cactorum]|uniref:Uncharacterized protein n=1 Tax=Phytophthora cactorum TaxID=29920 RepID=A0A329SWY8_9STRA|nr:hypothetical protein PC110_g3361 [Phytophthora cactorum]
MYQQWDLYKINELTTKLATLKQPRVAKMFVHHTTNRRDYKGP